MARGDYNNLLNWIENKLGIDFEGRITEDYYKNNDLVKEDIERVKNKVDETANDRTVPIGGGKFRYVTREQTIDGINKFFENYMEPRLNENVKDSNESIIIERTNLIKQATTISELENARTVDINYLDSTFEKIRTTAETRQEKLFESQIDEARDIIFGSGSVEDIREAIRMVPSEVRDKVRPFAQKRLDRLIRAGVESSGTKIGRV